MVDLRRQDNSPLQPGYRVCQLKGKPGWWRIIGSVRSRNGRFVQADLDAGITTGRSWKWPKDLIVTETLKTYGEWQVENLDIGLPVEPVASEVVRVAPEYREWLEKVARESPTDTFSVLLGRLLRRLEPPPQPA